MKCSRWQGLLLAQSRSWGERGSWLDMIFYSESTQGWTGLRGPNADHSGCPRGGEVGEAAGGRGEGTAGRSAATEPEARGRKHPRV